MSTGKFCLGFPAWLILSYLCSTAVATMPAAPLYGISADGTIYQVDTATGQVSSSLATGLSGIVGMAFRDQNALYALTNRIAPANPGWLYTVSTVNGLATPVGPTGLSNIEEGDIAFDRSTRTLYGAYDTLNNGRRLFTLDTDTGAATLLPLTPGGDISAMAFSQNGTLYALDTGLGRLWTLDKATGGPLGYVAISGALGPMAGMSFDPLTGALYVADGGSGSSKLYTLNPKSGFLTTVGTTGLPAGLSGLAFVPEPGTLLLVIFGTAAARFRRR